MKGPAYRSNLKEPELVINNAGLEASLLRWSATGMTLLMKREKRELFEGYGTLILIFRLTMKCYYQFNLREELVILRRSPKLSTEVEERAQFLKAAGNLFAQRCVKVVFICFSVELDTRVGFQSKKLGGGTYFICDAIGIKVSSTKLDSFFTTLFVQLGT